MKIISVSKGIKGPRPIALHFANSQATWDGASKAGDAALRADIWHAACHERAVEFEKQLASKSMKTAFNLAVQRKARARKESFIGGINSYISRPYERIKSDTVISYQKGCITLHDYGGDGQPVLLVPSLVNPYYILDLMPGRSLVAYMKECGYRPFLLDWGNPGVEEQGFGLDAYIEHHLEPVLRHVVNSAGAAVPIIGYCMGGTLCTALAVRNPEYISKLVLLAAPWNFNTVNPLAGKKNSIKMKEIATNLPKYTEVGVDMLQAFFTSVDPTLSDRKFRGYHAGQYQGENAGFFSAMEIWANNGPALARQAALDCLGDWYCDNKPYEHKWLIGGQTIFPEAIECQVLVAAPKRDRLVPQESAFSLLETLQYGIKHEPPSGHIGMVVGNRARNGLWVPLVEWLTQ